MTALALVTFVLVIGSYLLGYSHGDSSGEWRGWCWGYDEGQNDAKNGVIFDYEKNELRRKEDK